MEDDLDRALGRQTITTRIGAVGGRVGDAGDAEGRHQRADRAMVSSGWNTRCVRRDGACRAALACQTPSRRKTRNRLPMRDEGFRFVESNMRPEAPL